MLGDISTGKTSLVYRFTQGYYREDGHPATTGAIFSVKKIQSMGGTTCNVQIWDTAGVPERTKFAHLYYKTADAAIICCDITNPQSYEVLRFWLEELRKPMSGTPVCIVWNE
jgi:small GTP-binding protein